MKAKILIITAVTVVVAALYGGWLAVRAHRNLVTLEVRNMEVREVVKKIKWQTWETIYLDTNVQGKVSLNVHEMPLESVLHIIGDQVNSRWAAIYPLYSSGKSLVALKKALRGEADATKSGWTNLQNRAVFGGGGPGPGGGMMFAGGGPMGATPAGAGQLVSLQIQSKDVAFASQAFNRFAQVRVVLEDGASGTVNLVLKKVPAGEAVAKLAKQANRSWSRLYTLRGDGGPRGPGGPMQFVMRDGPRGPEMTDEERDALRKQREKQEEELRQALFAEERQKLEEEQKQRQQMFQDMQNAGPDQRRERFAQAGGPNMNQRMLDRIRNTTPEQRAEQNRRMREMRDRRERGDGGPRQGGPGRGPQDQTQGPPR